MANKRQIRRPWQRPHGLTLLELLVVLFVLSLIAVSAISLADNADKQIRFETTRDRIEQIRTAIAGDSSLSANGSPLVTGYVADTGTLPVSVRDLLEQPDNIPLWSYNRDLDQWAGWRGPYLRGQSELTGNTAFRDGWGNGINVPLEDPEYDNFGWLFAVDPVDGTHGLLEDGAIQVQSLGADYAPGASADDDQYALDFPEATNKANRTVTLHDHQYQLPFTIAVRVKNIGTADSSSVAEVVARVYYPDLAGTSTGSHATGMTYSYAESMPTTFPETLAGETQTLAFDFDSTHFSPDTTARPGIPQGVRTLFIVESSSSPFDPATQPLRVLLLPGVPIPDALPTTWEFADTPFVATLAPEE